MFTVGAVSLPQHCLYCVPQQLLGRSSQRNPYPAPDLPALLLAGNVAVHHLHVRCVPWMRAKEPNRGQSCELIYSFPIEAPMMVLHVDGYQAGKESRIKGSTHYLISCCSMCTFAAIEPISHANSTTYVSAIMKIILCYGFCHTIVLDRDSNFFGVCCKALDL
jgi:hypothetical protein